MRVTTRFSENSTSAALNTVAHAAEHCAVDPATLSALDSAVGRQLVVRQAPRRLALYTVVAIEDVEPGTVQVGTAGRARLGRSFSQTLTATVETAFAENDPQAPARLTEEMLGAGATGPAILAPHGGMIERYTDHQAESVYERLTLDAKPVRAWIARGFNSGSTGAHTCWHITSSEISEHSFALLRPFFARARPRGPFAHAVAFHGHDASEVIVGGGRPRDDTHTQLKTELSRRIREALSQVTDEPPDVEVRLSGPLAGHLRSNIVNRVARRGNGIQIEQPRGVRSDPEQREAIARAVADFYVDLL